MPNAPESPQSPEIEQQIMGLKAKIMLLRGNTVTTEQRQAVRDYDQQLIDEFLHNCPRGQYSTISGKQFKLLGDIHAGYGVPVGAGDNVDIVEVIRWFHDFLSTWGPKVKKQQFADEESLVADREREKLELRRMQAQILKIESEVERRRSESVSIEEVRKVLAWLAGELRKLGERLGKRFGADAQRAMNESLLRIETTLADELVAK